MSPSTDEFAGPLVAESSTRIQAYRVSFPRSSVMICVEGDATDLNVSL